MGSIKCNTCQDLAALQVTIPMKELLESAVQGCESCLVVERRLRKLIKDMERFDCVELVVDSAMYAILWTKGKDCATVEFYTARGKSSCMFEFLEIPAILHRTRIVG